MLRNKQLKQHPGPEHLVGIQDLNGLGNCLGFLAASLLLGVSVEAAKPCTRACTMLKPRSRGSLADPTLPTARAARARSGASPRVFWRSSHSASISAHCFFTWVLTPCCVLAIAQQSSITRDGVIYSGIPQSSHGSEAAGAGKHFHVGFHSRIPVSILVLLQEQEELLFLKGSFSCSVGE